MSERADVITFKGNAKTLVGDEVKVGQKAPDATVVGNDLSPVRISDFRGKILVIASVPSIDTPVCDTETRRFNTEAGKLGSEVKVLTVSMDLPFAYRRWCGAAGIQHLTTASDYKDREFGRKYGLYIKELGLLTRAVIVIDREGTIRHLDVVKEVTSEPNYDAALAAVKKLG